MGQADGLTAVGVGCDLRHNLGGDVTGGGEAVGLLDQGVRDHRAILQHIFQVHQLTVGDGTGYIAHAANTIMDSMIWWKSLTSTSGLCCTEQRKVVILPLS